MDVYDILIDSACENSKASDVELGTHPDARREALCVSTVYEGDQEDQRPHGLELYNEPRNMCSRDKLSTTSSSRCLLLSGDSLDDVSNKPVLTSEPLLVSKAR